MKVYSAADDEYGGPGTYWTKDIEDARNYLDNPGFGGHTLFGGEIQDNVKRLRFDRDGNPSDPEVWNRTLWGFLLDHYKIRWDDVPMPGTKEFDNLIWEMTDFDSPSRTEYTVDMGHKIEHIAELLNDRDIMAFGSSEFGMRGYPYSVWEDSTSAMGVLEDSGYDVVEYYDDYPSGCMTMMILTDAAEVKNIETIEYSEVEWQKKRRLRSGGVGRGWHHETMRHALAARGIRTK